jgi:GTPase SAR1 family protein
MPPFANNSGILLIKVILVGDSGIGKSALLSRYIYNKYPDNPLMTIGASFVSVEETVNDCFETVYERRCSFWRKNQVSNCK